MDRKLKVIPTNAPPGGGWAATYVGDSSPLNDIRLNMEQPDCYTNCINPANPPPPPPPPPQPPRKKKMVSVISSPLNPINVNSGFFLLLFFSTVASALTGSCEESGHLTALSLSSAQPPPPLQSHLQNISSDFRVKRLIQAFILPCLKIMCNFRWECWL